MTVGQNINKNGNTFLSTIHNQKFICIKRKK